MRSIVVCCLLLCGVIVGSTSCNGHTIISFDYGKVADVNNENLDWVFYGVADTWPTPQYSLMHTKFTILPPDPDVFPGGTFSGPEGDSGADPDDLIPIQHSGESKFHPDKTIDPWDNTLGTRMTYPGGLASLFSGCSMGAPGDEDLAWDFYGFKLNFGTGEGGGFGRRPDVTSLWPGKYTITGQTYAWPNHWHGMGDIPSVISTQILDTVEGKHWHMVRSEYCDDVHILGEDPEAINNVAGAILGYLMSDGYSLALDILKDLLKPLAPTSIRIEGVDVDKSTIESGENWRWWWVDCPTYKHDVHPLWETKARHESYVPQTATLHWTRMEGHIYYRVRMTNGWETTKRKATVTLRSIDSWSHPDLPAALCDPHFLRVFPWIMDDTHLINWGPGYRTPYDKIHDQFFEDNNHLRGMAAHKDGDGCWSCWNMANLGDDPWDGPGY